MDKPIQTDDDVKPDPAIESLSHDESEEAIERAGPRAPVIYASISARGREEMARPFKSLFGSGVSAGLILSLSFITEGLFANVLPQFAGRAAVADIGYTVGFILVILGRMQLFTEDTITPILPLLSSPTGHAFFRTGRLWLVVFTGNMVGMLIAAATLAFGEIVRPDQLVSIVEVSSKVLENTPLETFRYGIVAGFLIAALVWCMPMARGGELALIFVVSYIIALGDFTHVVAGSGEAFLLAFSGDTSWTNAVFGIILPAFLGNVFGGTVLFATLAYVQVMEEISSAGSKSRNTSDGRRGDHSTR